MDGIKWTSLVLYVADGNVKTMYMEHSSSNYRNSNRASRRGAGSEDL